MLPSFRDRPQAMRQAIWRYGLMTVMALLALGLQYLLPPGSRWVPFLVAAFWGLVGMGLVRVFVLLVLDPLLRRTRVQDYIRDLLVMVLYVGLAVIISQKILKLSPTQIFGTGAIAAAILGLSLQETLGNLFAGISLSLDGSFQVGDWIEVSLPGPSPRHLRIGQVQTMTWRAIQLLTDNGDVDIIPNRMMAQAVVSNLNFPPGFHRRLARFTLQPSEKLHEAIELLIQALSGIPHPLNHPPRVVTPMAESGGVVLEAQIWTLGWRHSKASIEEMHRLAHTVLPREGFRFVGIHGPTHSIRPYSPHPSQAQMDQALSSLGLPSCWAGELQKASRLCQVCPGEGVIREGQQGHSLFLILEGVLQVVRPVERDEPYHGLFWETLSELHPGAWFGEVSLLTGAPRSATVRALTGGLLLEISKQAFDRALKEEPTFLETMLALLEKRQRDANDADSHPMSLREQWFTQMKAWFKLQ